jgi:signal transduction histidine kinase
VAHGIVVSHGGDLMVESEPGQGTAIHVYLPACLEHAELAFEREARAS